MKSILILYSTTDGHTIKICQKISAVAEISGHTVRLAAINSLSDEELVSFDKIVVGASIRYGKHHQELFDFVANNKALLAQKSSAFFTVNVVARKANKNAPHNNPYLKKFLSEVSWEPNEVAVFAGKIDYQKYRFFDRMIIRFIMYLTKGPTHPKTVSDFTNWGDVERFAKVISE